MLNNVNNLGEMDMVLCRDELRSSLRHSVTRVTEFTKIYFLEFLIIKQIFALSISKVSLIQNKCLYFICVF